MNVLSNYLANLIEYASHKGLTGVRLENPATPYISALSYLEAFEHVYALAKDPYFGLHFGSYLNLKALGSVYDIALQTSNIKQAIELWKDYSKENFPLVDFHTLSVKDTFVFELHSEIENQEIRTHILDAALAFIYREVLVMTGGAKIGVVMPEVDPKEHPKWFNATLSKGTTHSLVFDTCLLDKEINTSRQTEIDMKLPKFLQMIGKEKQGYGRFALLVRNMTLNMCSPELPTLNQVASQFCVTGRTLQRSLAKEDITFRQITNDIKKELFTYLSTGLKVKTNRQLAHTLGYSNTSSLIHATKSWEAK